MDLPAVRVALTAVINTSMCQKIIFPPFIRTDDAGKEHHLFFLCNGAFNLTFQKRQCLALYGSSILEQMLQ